jgi:cephalosporin-C deacetylase-like acetyl esterase
MRAGLVKFTLLVALLFSASSPLLAQDPKLVRHFDYEKTTPLDIKNLGIDSRGEARIYDITYASPKGGAVPAYLVVPAKAKGPFAAIIWGHWYWQNAEMRNRKQFLGEAVALASTGVVSLLTDGPVARRGHVQDRTPLNEQQATDMVQQVIDMRRGLDLLLARKDVDPHRIAFVGHSYNASVGAILSGVDKRFKAFVLMAGTMSDEVDLKSESYQNFRKKVGPEKFDSFMAAHSYLDCGKYVSHAAPAIVFLQYATQEDFLTPERAREYERVVSEPKRFKLYEAPHSLNKEARGDRIAFLTEQLKLKPLPANLIDGIPDLYQPPRPN